LDVLPSSSKDIVSVIVKRRRGPGRARNLVIVAYSVLVPFGVRNARADANDRPLVEALSVGPSTCLDKPALVAHVRMWTRKSQLDRHLAIDVTDTSRGMRFVLRRDNVVIGERVLDIENVPCAEVNAAVGLGIASALDATLLADLGVAAPVALPLPAPAIPDHPTPPRTQPEITPNSALSVEVEGAILIDVLPRPIVGVATTLDVALSRSLDVRTGMVVTATETVPVGSGNADVTLGALRLDMCARRPLGSNVAVRACLGGLGGGIHARGAAFASPHTTTSPWLAGALRLEIRGSLTRAFGLVGGADAFFPALKPELQALGADGRLIAAEALPVAGIGLGGGLWLAF
jgi:hypothetical protein